MLPLSLKKASILAFVFCHQFVFAQQAPGGVTGTDVWYADADASGLIANHRSFNLLQFESALSNQADVLSKATTYFFVLQPRNVQSTGAMFMELGRVKIYDDRIEHGQSTTTLSFHDGLPRIVAITCPPSSTFGRRMHPSTVRIVDSSLFKVAEVVLYNERLNRADIHKVTSYLALKYSISITQNKEKKWRDYLKADSTFYWSTYIDRLFDQRVIGIGNSQDERFNQTQTVTSSGAFVQVSLDTPMALGSMPNVSVGEDAFIVFSERKAQGQAYVPCVLNQSTDNPLTQWKFKLHDWISPAQFLIVRIEKPKGRILDSLFLFDGTQRWHLPKTEVDSTTIEYKIYFDMLNNNHHYFFVESYTDPCPVNEIQVVGNEIMVTNFSEFEDPWTLETQSLKTGVSISQEVSGATSHRFLNEGQHLISIIGADGELKSVDVVSISATNEDNASTVQPELMVFPNPAIVNKQLTLRATGLSSDSPILVVLSDAAGNILRREELQYSSQLEYYFKVPLSGVYHVSLYQDNVRYSLKVVAAQ